MFCVCEQGPHERYFTHFFYNPVLYNLNDTNAFLLRDADKRAAANAKKQAQALETKTEADSNKISQDVHAAENEEKSSAKPGGDSASLKPPHMHHKKKVEKNILHRPTLHDWKTKNRGYVMYMTNHHIIIYTPACCL